MAHECDRIGCSNATTTTNSSYCAQCTARSTRRCESSEHDVTTEPCDEDLSDDDLDTCGCGRTMCTEHTCWTDGSGSYAVCQFCCFGEDDEVDATEEGDA
jgi:hypothetical protein